ncbi:hypothetical protein HY417_03985 [Candidatus Kaiserbacteria bacterium]|nr:hypothetical protein [Candidatus Kaiserbacteria bacterium]
MKISAVALLVGVLAVGAFGFLGMNPDMNHDGGCIASLVNVATCPLEGLSSALYHMSAYASFSQAVFTSSLILLALALLALLAFAGLRAGLPIPVHSRSALHARHVSSFAPRRKFIHWLSLFENSPSLFRSA